MTQRKKILVVDDVRHLDLFTADVTYARTVDQGIRELQKGGWDELHLDFDFNMQMTGATSGGIVTAQFTDSNTNGLTVLITCHLQGIPLPSTIRLITTNADGLVKLSSYLQNELGYQKTGFTGRMFVKP